MGGLEIHCARSVGIVRVDRAAGNRHLPLAEQALLYSKPIGQQGRDFAQGVPVGRDDLRSDADLEFLFPMSLLIMILPPFLSCAKLRAAEPFNALPAGPIFVTAYRPD